MSNTNGIVRFLLFVAVVALIATGYYASTLKAQVAQLDGARSSLTVERDALKTKVDSLTKDSADASAKLKDSEAKVADLQAKLEEAQKPKSRSRRR